MIVRVTKDEYQQIWNGQKAFVSVPMQPCLPIIGETITIVALDRDGNDTDRYMPFVVTCRENLEEWMVIGFQLPERTQITTVNQNGRNNYSIQNCGTLNL